MGLNLFDKVKSTLFESFMKDGKSTTGPYEELDLRLASVDEHKDVSRQGIFLDDATHLVAESVEGLS